MVGITWLLVFCGFSVVFREGKHLLMVLLGLEVVRVGVFGLIRWVVLSSGISCRIALIFLTFAVCEAVLGLRVLISCVRGFGGEKVRAVFSIKY